VSAVATIEFALCSEAQAAACMLLQASAQHALVVLCCVSHGRANYLPPCTLSHVGHRMRARSWCCLAEVRYLMRVSLGIRSWQLPSVAKAASQRPRGGATFVVLLVRCQILCERVLVALDERVAQVLELAPPLLQLAATRLAHLHCTAQSAV
jgi:hypothetical protein